MHNILLSGHVLKTTDDIALAIIDLSTHLALTGGAARVTFPIAVDGAVSRCTAVVTGSWPTAAIALPDGDGSLPGAAEAVSEIRALIP